MLGWTPDWVPCVRVDLPAEAAPRRVFELTTALDPLLAAIKQSVTGHAMFAVGPRALEAFEHHGLHDTINRLRALADARQIEFVGTAADDAILPLLPERELRRQLALADETGRRIFGDFYSPWLLWSPALATSPRVARIASHVGYGGMLVDELAMRGYRTPWPGDRVATCSRLPGFYLLPSSRQASRAFAEGRVHHADHWAGLGLVEQDARRYVVTTFEVTPTRKPRPLAVDRDFANTVRAAELLKQYPLDLAVAPLPSSELSPPQALHEGLPFAAWHAPDNDVHALQWQLALRMLAAVDALMARGLGPHPGVQALRVAVDHGWRRTWWEAASRSPMDSAAILDGTRRRRKALVGVRALLEPETHDALEQTIEALLSEVVDEPRQQGRAVAEGPRDAPLA